MPPALSAAAPHDADGGQSSSTALLRADRHLDHEVNMAYGAAAVLRVRSVPNLRDNPEEEEGRAR